MRGEEEDGLSCVVEGEFLDDERERKSWVSGGVKAAGGEGGKEICQT
jgi:hypothetical protein